MSFWCFFVLLQELWRAWSSGRETSYRGRYIPRNEEASWVTKTKMDTFHDKQVTKTPKWPKIVDVPKTLDDIQGLVLLWICDVVFWVKCIIGGYLDDHLDFSCQAKASLEKKNGGGCCSISTRGCLMPRYHPNALRWWNAGGGWGFPERPRLYPCWKNIMVKSAEVWIFEVKGGKFLGWVTFFITLNEENLSGEIRKSQTSPLGVTPFNVSKTRRISLRRGTTSISSFHEACSPQID